MFLFNGEKPRCLTKRREKALQICRHLEKDFLLLHMQAIKDIRGSTASNHRGVCCSLTKFWCLAKKKKKNFNKNKYKHKHTQQPPYIFSFSSGYICKLVHNLQETQAKANLYLLPRTL